MPLDYLQNKEAHPGKIFGEEIITRRQAVHLFAGANNKIIYLAADENETPIIPALTDVKIRFSEAILFDRLLKEISATSVDAQTGKITFEVPSEVQSSSGIYTASIGLFDSTSKLVHVENIYIYVEPSIWGSTEMNNALPQLEELRMAIRDTGPIENEILGDKQFSLEEICLAILRTIRLWNETPPKLRIETTQSFRYPHILKQGTQLFLFDSFLEWLRKNRLPYNAGGVQIDELGKLGEYTQALQMRFQEFTNLMTRTKAYENLRQGFAIIG